MSKSRHHKNKPKLILPAAEAKKKQQEAFQLLKDRLQEIRDADYTETEIFEEPRPTDNAGVTTFRVAMFLSHMTPLWKDRDQMFLKFIQESEDARKQG